MKAVGIKKLKNELSRYLHIVRSGESVLVLDRDEVVAEIRPTARRGAVDLGAVDLQAWDAFVAQRAAEGRMYPAKGRGPSMMALVEAGVFPEVPNARQIIEETRADRF
jgi:antitoxin (DNA-binding transcriptional repressor) of toxin-antitoxin stability system